jgi:glycosyltransferase involved in cell wall biosynthesis
MSYGLPVIATPEGGIPAMVQEGVTGYLVPHGNVAVLADALETLIRNPELCASMGENGRKRYLECFTLERFEQGLCNILQRACAWESDVQECRATQP